VAEVSQLGRNTQGVTLIRLPADEKLVSVMRLDAEEDAVEENVVDGDAPVDGGGSDTIGENPEATDPAETDPTEE
jgi:DNA gyrase subunit A